MSSDDVDRYLAGQDDRARETLQVLRRMLLELLPDAEEVISYGIPGYRIQGTTVAGYGAFSRHLSYFPHSGSVLDRVRAELGGALDGYGGTKSALHFPLDQPLPRELVVRLLRARLEQAGLSRRLG